MGERRAVGQVLNSLRERVEEGDAAEAEALAKTKIIERSRKAFKKSPDTPLGVVIQKKLAKRATPVQPNVICRAVGFQSQKEFDTLYNPGLHKRLILQEVRYLTNIPWFGPHKKKSRRIGPREREAATLWREAIFRDAPLLKGFFTEEPKWRERILRWCENAVSAGQTNLFVRSRNAADSM